MVLNLDPGSPEKGQYFFSFPLFSWIKNKKGNKSGNNACGEEQHVVVTLRVCIEGKQEVHAIQYLWVLGLINHHKIPVKVRWLALALL